MTPKEKAECEKGKAMTNLAKEFRELLARVMIPSKENIYSYKFDTNVGLKLINDLPKLLDELERYKKALELCKEQRNRFRHNAIIVNDKSDLWVRLDNEIQQILEGEE